MKDATGLEEGGGRVSRKWGPRSCNHEGLDSASRLSELMSDSSPASPEGHVAQRCLDVSLCDPEQGTGHATLHSDPQICGADKWVLFQTAQFVVICDTAVAI